MRELDEDALLDLHGRVRRARTKYMKLYRRQASARIANVGGRGAARPQNRRNADKAEVFEIALARVSKQVDVVARRTAARLKSERLAAVRAASKSASDDVGRKACCIAQEDAPPRRLGHRVVGARLPRPPVA